MATKGNCYFCGKTVAKTAIKNHILKEHNHGSEECCLLKAEGAYNKDYWLYFTVPANAKLSLVDEFLRNIWCECCGHLSAFRVGDYWRGDYDDDYGMEERLSAFNVGSVLPYEYDFGSTTYINVTIVSGILRPAQKEKICLIARNEPKELKCEQCEKPAARVDMENWRALCDDCTQKLHDPEYSVPITNSPRCGVCGYDGENDEWTFDPGKIKPQVAPKANSATATKPTPTNVNPKPIKPPKRVSIYSDEYTQHVKKCEEITTKNEVHLKNFEKHLTDKGLSKKTINNHVSNVDFYINDYLVHDKELDVKQGCYEVFTFMDWFMRKALWSSCAQIKANCASFKKFYAFMLESGVVEQEDYDELVETIKEEMPYWLEQMNEYDDMYDEY